MSLSVLRICVSVLLGSMVASAFPVHNVHGEDDSCTLIRNSACAKHFNFPDLTWYARFPNARGLNQDQSIREFNDFTAALKLNNYCSNRLYALLCWSYFPQCLPDQTVTVVPCREVCLEASEACRPHFSDVDFSQLRHLNCSNFPVSSPNSQDESSGLGEGLGSTATVHVKPACPPPYIHVDFCPNNGKRYNVSESAGHLEVCLKLSNAGSFERNATLAEEVTVKLSTKATSFSFLPRAEPRSDFGSFSSSTVVFPVGSTRGSKQCVNLEIIDDYLKEYIKGETFTIEANIISPQLANIGGAANSSVGSVEVIINDDEREITMPTAECKGNCNMRNRVNKKTFTKLPCYDYAIKAQVLQRVDGPSLIVNISQCWEKEPGACIKDRIVAIPYCDNCPMVTDFEEKYYVIAGRKNSNGDMILPNYKKAGIFGDWDNYSNFITPSILTCS